MFSKQVSNLINISSTLEPIYAKFTVFHMCVANFKGINPGNCWVGIFCGWLVLLVFLSQNGEQV